MVSAMKSLHHSLLSPEGVVLYASPAALNVRDLKLSEVAGKSVWNTPWLEGSPEAQDAYKQMVGVVAQTGIPEQRRLEINFDEKVRSFDVLISPVWTSDGIIIALTVEVVEANHILNEREKEVLEWTAKGKTSWEIAIIVGISQRTVEWHATRAREKLEAANTIDAVTRAVKSGWIHP